MCEYYHLPGAVQPPKRVKKGGVSNIINKRSEDSQTLELLITKSEKRKEKLIYLGY
jgi:hypothetical protein